MLGLHTDTIHMCTISSMQVLGDWSLVWSYTQALFTWVHLHLCMFWVFEHWSGITHRHHSHECPYTHAGSGGLSERWSWVTHRHYSHKYPYSNTGSGGLSTGLYTYLTSIDRLTLSLVMDTTSVWGKSYYSRVGREKLVNGRKCKTFEWGKGSRNLEMRKRLVWPGAGPPHAFWRTLLLGWIYSRQNPLSKVGNNVLKSFGCCFCLQFHFLLLFVSLYFTVSQLILLRVEILLNKKYVLEDITPDFSS